MKTFSFPPVRVVLFSACVVFLTSGVAAASTAPFPVLTDLGLLPAGIGSRANAVSANGKVVVGQGWDATYAPWIFRWTDEAGMVGLNGVAIQGSANALNFDGSVIVGGTGSNGAQQAFRWDALSGVQSLGDLGGTHSIAWGVSADGSVVVGEANDGAALRRAFRWTAALGMHDLGSLSVGGSSVASAISNDGAVIVGSAAATGGTRAFRWEGGTMVDLGTLPGSTSSGAFAVNADGNVVVGSSNLAAFRWTAASGMQDLGSLGGMMSSANGVSADGSVVVGTSTLVDDSSRAYRWTAATGMTNLGLLTGGSFSEATGVSADGNVVVGTADNSQGERAFIWKRSAAGLAPIQDLGNLQTSVIRSANASTDLLAMQGRRARLLVEQHCLPGAAQRYCLSADGAVSTSESVADGRQRIGQLGAGRRLNAQVSMGLNVAWVETDGRHGDGHEDRAHGLGLWAAYQQHADTGTGWLADLGASLSTGESRFQRGEHDTDVQIASSQVAIKATAQRLAVGYGVAVGDSRLVPELALTHVQGAHRGFEERNVALPLNIEDARSEQTYATATLRGSLPVDPQLTLTAALAMDVLLNEDAPVFQGQSDIPGLDQFEVRSPLRQRQLVPSATAGSRYALSPASSVAAQVHARASTFHEQRPVLGVQVQYRYAF